MANTYTQIYIQIVFAVEHRNSLIPKQHKDELHQFITGIVTNKNQKLIQINSMPDHIHILVGIDPDMAISELVQTIKANSSRFINNKQWTVGQFRWQKGFAAFSYSQSQLNQVANYIKNQEEHHTHKSFREEYVEFLNRFNVEYNERYIFHAVD